MKNIHLTFVWCLSLQLQSNGYSPPLKLFYLLSVCVTPTAVTCLPVQLSISEHRMLNTQVAHFTLLMSAQISATRLPPINSFGNKYCTYSCTRDLTVTLAVYLPVPPPVPHFSPLFPERREKQYTNGPRLTRDCKHLAGSKM